MVPKVTHDCRPSATGRIDESDNIPVLIPVAIAGGPEDHHDFIALAG
jgi:hypothetical protein